MPNGDCQVGGANKAAIEALNRWNERQDRVIDNLTARQDEAMAKLGERLNDLNYKADVQGSTSSRVMGGIIVACVLLIVNILISWAANSGGL